MKKIDRRIAVTVLSAVLGAAALTGCSSANAETKSAASVAAETEKPAEAKQEGGSDAESTGQLADIQKAGKLIVGVEGTYAPYTFHGDDGELTGFDVELAQLLAEKLHVEVEFVESDWDSLLAGVDSGRLDTVINDVSVTDERREKYDFSDAYIYIPQQVVQKTGSSLTGIEDLKGKKVATNKTNAYAPVLEGDYGATIVGISTSDEAANLVISGRADFCMFSPITLNDYLDQHPEAPLEVAFKLGDSYETIAIPYRKGETALVEATNQALKELSEDGTLVALSDKYFRGDYTKTP